jgi:RNA polymerase sigma factor (sigma-70 family)
LRITKNKEDAEDVLQDTFLRAFLSLSSFERRSSFYSWLTRIGINSALMLLRKRRVRVEMSFDLPFAEADHSLQDSSSQVWLPIQKRLAIFASGALGRSKQSRGLIPASAQRFFYR